MYPSDIERYKAATQAGDWRAIAALNDCNFDTFGTKKEFGVLSRYLEPTETVLAFASGLVSGGATANSSDKGTSTWLVALTDERFLLLDHALLTKSVDTQSIRLANVQAVSASQGFILAKLTIDLAGRLIVVDSVQKKDAAAVVEIANRLLKERETRPVPASGPVIDFADQLTKLAGLRDSGVLTEEEFTEAKRKILAAI
jgi:hypothetical protein